MKKKIVSYIASTITCVALFLCMAGCGQDKSVNQRVYTGEIPSSEGANQTVELTLDDCGTFTLMYENEDGVGGVYRDVENGMIFELLDGEKIATAISMTNGLILNYNKVIIELDKIDKTVKTDELYGAYKGYVYDDGAFELRIVLRGDNDWVLIEEDGDIRDYGKYTLEGDLIAAYNNDEPNKICLYGTISGQVLILNMEGDEVRFQKVN